VARFKNSYLPRNNFVQDGAVRYVQILIVFEEVEESFLPDVDCTWG